MIVLFWICLFVIVYTYIGYGLLLYLSVMVKRLFFPKKATLYNDHELPTATLIIAAYNEAAVIREKIENSLELHYPENKLTILVVTDGSTDDTPLVIQDFPAVKLLHQDKRSGKINAIHRVMQQVQSEVVIFTDANTILNREALVQLSRHYKDKTVGAVAGEKRVHIADTDDATAGEGIYWMYESKLKKWNAELLSVVGAAGELFSLRTELYAPVPPDTILDDFMLSMNVALRGYRIVYEPAAYAHEMSSATVQEEIKRKVRIAAGAMQAVVRLKKLFNFFQHPVLSFQYISHRVLRWTVTPFLLVLVFFLNLLIVAGEGDGFYRLLMVLQVAFYGLALAGHWWQQRPIKATFLFIPYYFCVMNYALLTGIRRYVAGRQKVAWEKAERKKPFGISGT